MRPHFKENQRVEIDPPVPGLQKINQSGILQKMGNELTDPWRYAA
jgi:hypothetical protein